jgi:hypothetical protein
MQTPHMTITNMNDELMLLNGKKRMLQEQMDEIDARIRVLAGQYRLQDGQEDDHTFDEAPLTEIPDRSDSSEYNHSSVNSSTYGAAPAIVVRKQVTLEDHFCCMIRGNLAQSYGMKLQDFVAKRFDIKGERPTWTLQNGLNVCIRISTMGGNKKTDYFNISQIRPHENIDYYFVFCYIANDDSFKTGDLTIFICESDTLYEIVADYGNYCRVKIGGKKKSTHPISQESMGLHLYTHDRDTTEYMLDMDPNRSRSMKGKSWDRLCSECEMHTAESFGERVKILGTETPDA